MKKYFGGDIEFEVIFLGICTIMEISILKKSR